MITGAESSTAVDLSVASQGWPLVVRRTYESYDAIAGNSGPFGYGWSWEYGAHAIQLTDGSVDIVESCGVRLYFWKNGTSFTPDADVHYSLAAAPGGGYTLTRSDQTTWSFNANGQLTALADRNGNTQTLGYNGANLATVTAPGGRSLAITTDGNGHITQISGSGGLSASYTYDSDGRLLTETLKLPHFRGQVTTWLIRPRSSG